MDAKVWKEVLVQNRSKIIFLIMDGLGGLPMSDGGKTELETAVTPNFNQYAKEAVLWSRKELSVYNKAYLENLLFTYEIGKTLFVHSTPVDPEEWQYIFSEYEARQNLNQIEQEK